jgi:carbonic anhydrase/acetyltransferase-like protein (isoleucine patch superfamily)
MALYALGDRSPDIHPDAFVHAEAVVIGRVKIGAGSSIWPGAVLRGDGLGIVVGERTSIQDGAVIHCTRRRETVIGDDCVVGHLAHLEACTIESGSLIGTGSIVLHRAVVRSGALVGAGAVVPNDMEVPSRSMALGVPAKIRPDTVNPADIIEQAAGYVANAAHHKANTRRLDT